MIEQFSAIHAYSIDENGVTDADTLALASDTVAVYRSLYQGMAPLGEWIQSRIAYLVRQWLPKWKTSHGQVYDSKNRAIQSRSWDIIVHRPIPADKGYPPPATPDGPWSLVPKELCCAVIDTKGQYNTPQHYANKPAFDLLNTCPCKQLDILHPSITPILFIIASTHTPQRVEAAGIKADIPIRTFVMARSVPTKLAGGTQRVAWKLNAGRYGVVPLQAFRQTMLDAARRWEECARS